MPTWTLVNLVDDKFHADDVAGVATALKLFRVEAAEVISAIDALLASKDGVTIPVAGESYSPLRPFCRVSGRDVSYVNPRAREIRVDFSDPTNGLVLFPPDLLTQSMKWSTSDGNGVEEYFIDRSEPDQKFVVNAAGEPLDRGPTRAANSLIMQGRKFVNAATRQAILNSLHTTNISPKTIDGITFDENELYLAHANFNPLGETLGMDTTGIYEALIAIEFKPGGWADEYMNVGYSTLSEVEDFGLVRFDITQDDGSGNQVRVTKPVPLSIDGTTALDPNATPNTIKRQPYFLRPWTGVPLT